MLMLLCPGTLLAAEQKKTSSIEVNVLNYVRASTAAKFDGLLARAGGINRWSHGRKPVPIDKQRISRMNRDTLYSSVVVNISQGASLILPDSGSRYMSATVVDQDHYINKIFHGAGEHKLSMADFNTPYVLLTVRTLVNPSDPDDIIRAIALQDALVIKSTSDEAYHHPSYDQESYQTTHKSLQQLAKSLPDARRTYGSKQQVDKVRHLLGSAYGWGGLPETETVYINVQPQLPVAQYSLTVKDVPVDGFWSISVYNKQGFFEQNPYDAYSLNNLTAKANPDGSYTLNFGTDPSKMNFLPITPGWNYVVRLYRPGKEITDGSWRFPEVTASMP